MSEPHIDTEEGQLLHNRRVMLMGWNTLGAFSSERHRINTANYILSLENFIKRHHREGWLRKELGLLSWRRECAEVELYNELTEY